jgi:hypothetical protein
MVFAVQGVAAPLPVRTPTHVQVVVAMAMVSRVFVLLALLETVKVLMMKVMQPTARLWH